MGIESKELQAPQPDELLTLINQVSKLIGDEKPLTFQEKYQTGSTVPAFEVADEAMRLEMVMREKSMVEFDAMVKLSVQMNMLRREQIQEDSPSIDLDKPDPIDEISMRTTLWLYDDAHLKEFVNVVKEYAKHIQKHSEIAENIRRNPKVQELEVKVVSSLRELQKMLPVMEQLHRIIKYSYLLQTKEFSDAERLKLEELISWLQREVAKSPLDLPDDYTEAAGVMEERFRAILAETTELNLRGSGTKLASAETRTMRIGQALYLRTLSLHRDQSLEEIKKTQKPTVQQYETFLALQKTLNALNMQHLLREAKHNADYQGLLATLAYFGPRTEELRSNPQAASQYAEYFQKYVLSEEIKDQFTLKEFARAQEGMESYLQLVEGDVLRYGKWADDLEYILVEAADLEKKGIAIKHGVAKWSYIVPEYTLGFARIVGLDYAKLFGQAEAMENHREFEEFLQLEESTDSIAAILSEQKPIIDAGAREVRSASAALRSLREEYPPSACTPGETFNGKTYEEIEQMYKDAIDAVREAHKAYCENVDTLYQKLEENMAFHINRMAQNRLLNDKNAPNAVVGVGITAGEALTVAAWLYGGKRGLRAVPGIAQATGLGWVKSPSKNVASWMLKTIVNAPIRIVNAPTRLLIKLSGFQWAVPRSRLDASPRELRALERELAQLRGSAEAQSATGPTQAPRSTPFRAEETLEALADNPSALRALEELSQQEAVIEKAREELELLWNKKAQMSEEVFRRADQAIRQKMIVANKKLKSLRIAAAKNVLRRVLPFSRAQREAIIQAHEATSTFEKARILKSAQFSSKERRLLMQPGVCGEVAQDILSYLDDVPTGARRMIERSADGAADVRRMAKGFSTLKELAGATGIDALFLLYDTWQLTNLWRSIGELEEWSGPQELKRLALEKKQGIAWYHGVALGVDALTVSAGGAAMVLGKGSALYALMATPAGVVVLVGLPAVASAHAGIYAGIAKHELHQVVTLHHRVEGHDEQVLEQSPYDQLYELGDTSGVQWIASVWNNVSLAELDTYNETDRKEILLSQVVRNMRDMRPELMDAFLKKLGESFDTKRPLQKNEVNLMGNLPIGKAILGYLSEAFVHVAKSKGDMSDYDIQRLQVFDIDRNFFRKRLTEKDVRGITYNAAQLLEHWVEGNSFLAQNTQEVISTLREEKLIRAQEDVRLAFGASAEKVLSHSEKEIADLQQRYSHLFVDVHYYLHSGLRGLQNERRKGEQWGVPFVAGWEEDISQLRMQLDALNAYAQAKYVLPKAFVRPAPEKRISYFKKVSPAEAFLEADGQYMVNEVDVAMSIDPQKLNTSEVQSKVGARSFAKTERLQQVSEYSHWGRDLKRAYNSLLEEYSF